MKPRIPEGGAIEGSSMLSMNQYSQIMKKVQGRDYDRFADQILSHATPASGGRVLEIGPGPGWAGISLLKKRPDLTLEGIEPSPDMLQVAVMNAETEGLGNRVAYRQGCGEDMGILPSHAFDLVISRESLHHWTEPDKVFLEIFRVLKPGGKIYIQDHRRDLNLAARMIVSLFSLFIPGKLGRFWKSSIAAAYTKGELEQMLHPLNNSNLQIEAGLMDLAISSR